jgi:CheY-like chemotaxis protein
MQAAVFEMFVQVDQSLGRGHAGLGVGLSLARQLVLLHGGSIELRSAGLGQGSTFSVRLGRVPGPWSGALAEPAAAAATPGRPTRVLVADDNRDSADSLAEVLRFIGYEVQVAYDGTAALQASAAHMPDVGLFDIGMPGLNGYELASAVRRLPGGAGIFLVALTGWGQTDDRRRAREAGFDHHFVKPVDVDVVADLVAARSGQAQARRADSPRDCAP